MISDPRTVAKDASRHVSAACALVRAGLDPELGHVVVSALDVAQTGLSRALRKLEARDR